MSVIFSRSSEYAVQAVLYLARHSGNHPILLGEISTALGIPRHFLSKVLQSLAHQDIVVSHKGIHGGFELGRPATEVTLFDIVKTIQGEAFLNRCVLGFPGCGEANPCPVHPIWKQAKDIIFEMLHQKTVADLAKELGSKLELIKRLAS